MELWKQESLSENELINITQKSQLRLIFVRILRFEYKLCGEYSQVPDFW